MEQEPLQNGAGDFYKAGKLLFKKAEQVLQSGATLLQSGTGDLLQSRISITK